jgi:alkanesulfonate monooxygenase SsuD/methylene tetrahydromethanopterin reductase-like flavin-dependent oxidoreductase (luciferase family)
MAMRVVVIVSRGGPILERSREVYECWTTLGALAVATSRIGLGTLVLGNTYRHPALVVNMAATLDRVSGGSVLLGLGAGWQTNEHTAYAAPE